jgi:hypothetical protein
MGNFFFSGLPEIVKNGFYFLTGVVGEVTPHVQVP